MDDRLPDVALDRVDTPPNEIRVESAGMTGVKIPVPVATSHGVISVPAAVDARVNLISPHKGIHMSRLYEHIGQILPGKPLTIATASHLAEQFLSSHQGLSDSAFLKVAFELVARRKALISNRYGWISYPVCLEVSKRREALEVTLECVLTYSSTCPCSAALSRQLIQERFDQCFAPQATLSKGRVLEWLGEQGNFAATPHSQRSTAIVRVGIQSISDDPMVFSSFCDQFERILATPVQTLVKRQDEKEFARLNGQNLMFCEDAARRFKRHFETLKARQQFRRYFVRVEHHESLHAHDAVAEVCSSESYPL